MKKLIIFAMSFCLMNSFAYASFPVVDDNMSSEVISVNQEESSSESNIVTPPVEFHFGGFLLGLLLGLIGVGLAYIFSSNADFRRNAWYGFGTWIILLLLLSAAAA